MQARVLLLHGIWMRGLSMSLLAYRLRKRGFRTQIIDYSSIFGGFPAADRALQHALTSERGTTHIVGHSLGGLMAIESLLRHPPLHCDRPARMVCLGSPLAGSSAARGLSLAGGAWFLGRSAGILKSGVLQLPQQLEVAMVAGSIPRGVGRIFARFDECNDGTVSQSETRLRGLQEHLLVPVSHTGLIFSAQVAELTANFLQTGHFRP